MTSEGVLAQCCDEAGRCRNCTLSCHYYIGSNWAFIPVANFRRRRTSEASTTQSRSQ